MTRRKGGTYPLIKDIAGVLGIKHYTLIGNGLSAETLNRALGAQENRGISDRSLDKVLSRMGLSREQYNQIEQLVKNWRDTKMTKPVAINVIANAVALRLEWRQR